MFSPGDKVRVVDSRPGDDNTTPPIWLPRMNAFCGVVGTVEEVDDDPPHCLVEFEPGESFYFKEEWLVALSPPGTRRAARTCEVRIYVGSGSFSPDDIRAVVEEHRAATGSACFVRVARADFLAFGQSDAGFELTAMNHPGLPLNEKELERFAETLAPVLLGRLGPKTVLLVTPFWTTQFKKGAV